MDNDTVDCEESQWQLRNCVLMLISVNMCMVTIFSLYIT